MDARKTTSLLMVFLFLNLSLGAMISSLAVAGSAQEINYTIRVSKDSGTTLVQTSAGQTIYSGNSDVEAIKAAVNAIDTGTILIDSGTYMISSPVSLKSNIEVVGNTAVLKGYRIFAISGATNVRISGFEFTGPDQLYGAVGSSSGLINIVNSNNCIIESNTFRNFRDYGVNVAVGSTSHKNEQITIRNNQFLDYGYCGVMIWKQSYHIYVEDNTFKNINTRAVNANAYGVAVAKGSNSYKHSEYIYIRHNWIENSPIWEGIDSHGANHVYIQDNTVLNCKVPIAVSYQTSEGSYPLPVHDIVITGNYVKGNMNSPYKQHSGIHVLGARNYAQPYTNINVSGNTIVDVNSWLVSDDGAIVLRDVNGGIVDNNLINGVGGTGINLKNADNLVVQNNDIKNLIQISGSTKGVEMQAVVKAFSTTIRDNSYDSSVGYHGYANSGYTYSVKLINEVSSKFGGSLKLTTMTDTPASSTVEPPLTPPEPRPLGEVTDPDTGTDTVDDTDTGTDTGSDTGADTGTDPGSVSDIEHDISVYRNSGTTVVKTGDGEVIYSGSNDVEALKAAVNAIDQGTILVNAGTYTVSSQVPLKSGIELIGDGAVLKGYSIFRISDATDVKVTGFTFSDPDQTYLVHAGSTGLVEIENSENCLVENNTFTNFRDYGIDLETPTATSHNKNITIKDNNFLDYGYAGVMIGKQASNVYVENNLFKDINTRKLNGLSYGVAIAHGSSTYQYSEYIYIRNNTIENNPVWEGIDSLGANYLFIENNNISNCRIPISVAQINDDGKYPVPVHDVTIKGNYLKGDFTAEKQDSGIYVLGGRNRDRTVVQPYIRAYVHDNTIVDVNNWLVSDDGAIVLRHVKYAVIKGNDISGTGGTGINLQDADEVVMQDNEIKNMKQIADEVIGIKMLPVSQDNIIVLINNTFDGSATHNAYSNSNFGYKYQVNLMDQDTSNFYTSNGGMDLVTLSETEPEIPPADDVEETPSETEEDAYPVAKLAIRVVPYGNGLTFDGGESTDDNGIVSYSWDFDASDGIQEEASGEVVSRDFPVLGRFEVTMTVTDIKGQQDTDSLLIVVN